MPAEGSEAVTLSQLKMLGDSLTSGGGFTGTAMVHIAGDSISYAYIDEGYQLVENLSSSSGAVNLTVPIPQIMIVETQGKNEKMSISGDYTLIRSFSHPQGRIIYIFGDVTATGI